jgi:predicted MFS family arabinose efflux permease
MPAGLTAVFAVACGLMVANLYYAQALIGDIAPALGLHDNAAGLIVTLTQLGYGAGLLFIVSLADLVENKRLILTLLAGATLGLVGIVFARSAAAFLLLSFLTGFCSVGAQVLVPLAAHLAPEHRRGRVVGNIMGGLIAGIMLARPVANGLAVIGGWRLIFGVSAVASLALAAVLAFALPQRRPAPGLHYGQILQSSLLLLLRTPVIRRRTAYQASLFAAFNLFWTAVPLLLARQFGLGQIGIGLFALAGAGGALAAPIAGRAADRNWIRSGTFASLAAAMAACLLAGWSGAAHALIALAIAAIVLDAGTQFNQVIGQRVLYSILPDARGRINASYMTCVFIGGAIGSSLAGWTFGHGGWWTTALTGAALLIPAMLLFLSELGQPTAVRPAQDGPPKAH